MEKTHGRSYGLVKKIIAAGKMNKYELLNKVDLIFAAGGLTDDDYAEITKTLNGGE